MTPKPHKDIHAHLAPGEQILWQGRPERGSIWLLLFLAVYVAVFVVGFIIPTAAALNSGDFSNLSLTVNGEPVTNDTPRSTLVWSLIGVSSMTGGFCIVGFWWIHRESKEVYAVTNERALIVRPSPFAKVVSLRDDAFSRIETSGSGKLRTLSFSYSGDNSLLRTAGRFSYHPNAFRNIPDAPYVEDLIATNLL